MLSATSPASRAHHARNDIATSWHRRAAFYQIYPLSFCDSNGDGKGDLRGIIGRIDYLRWLGVDAIWLGPVYASPMRDFGYDVSDFTGVDPTFGTLDDFDCLLERLHAARMRLVLDFVPNHTSDRHPWFEESRAARSNPRRDWYIWRDPAPDGGPPNNWTSRFGGSAWSFDARSGQYYYHAFLESQPDLNWRNASVRKAIADALRFWLRRGVDGFRLDAAAVLAEDEYLRDDPPNVEATDETPPPERLKRLYTNYRPEVLDWLAELRAVADEFPERVLLGEVDAAPDVVSDFYGTYERPILHAPLAYRLLDTPWNADALAEAIDQYLGDVPSHGWPVWAIGSHDKERIATKAGEAQARVAAMLALTLRGTPIFYAGDEIGMQSVDRPAVPARDPFERRLPGYGLNRDGHRTPMQWNADRHAGFSEATPWLRVADDYQQRNVACQQADDRSLLHLYRALLALRHTEPALVQGKIGKVTSDDGVLAYVRSSADRELCIVLNTTAKPRAAALPHCSHGAIVLSTRLEREREAVGDACRLHANEGVIVELKS